MAFFIQHPVPGTHLKRYCGDVLTLRLESSSPITGQAFFRTNLGNGSVCRQEIISSVEEDRNPSLQAWHNLPMERLDEFTFTLEILLHEEGHFEGKCFVAKESASGTGHTFVEGDNIHINVENGAYCCANGVYCAFVRQFGRNKEKEFSTLPAGVDLGDLENLDKHSYSVIPPSGTFRDLIKELPHIFDRLHCRILHLLPIHPGPTVYGRMGRFGSPYAALDFTAVNPELAEFDRSATALDQFRELVDAVHGKGGKLFIDIAINHTGWGAKLHETHPEWFVKESSGIFHSPGAWGVTWGDLTELDHTKEDLWKYLAGVFRLWCTRGVDGFRCDAGYMIPLPAWKYIIARVREEFPETVFLLEGLGGDPAVTAELLNSGNMNWAYSELFQNYRRDQIEGYLNYAWSQSAGNGLMIHYAETHDNARLAALSHEYARMRTALAALASVNGAFGFTNGVEFFAKEKIDVHEDCALNWGSSVNQVDFIGRLNGILRTHPSFRNGASVGCIESSSPDCVLIGRNSPEGADPLLIAVNLDTGKSHQVLWNISSAPFRGEKAIDLLSGRSVEFVRSSSSSYSLQIPGGGVFCFTQKRTDLERLDSFLRCGTLSSGEDHLEIQEAKALLASVLVRYRKSVIAPCGAEELLQQAKAFLRSPEEFLRHLYGQEKAPPFVVWNFPEDLKRDLMVPPGYSVLVKSPERIRAVLECQGHLSSCPGTLRDAAGNYFLLIEPRSVPGSPLDAKLHCGIFARDGKVIRNSSNILYLPQDILTVRTGVDRKALRKETLRFMIANGRGALMYLPIDPEALPSRYDALLLSNLSDAYPENRHIMLRRFRFWCIYDTKSAALSRDCFTEFYMDEEGSCGVWLYHVPAGSGLFADLSVRAELLKGVNAVRITVQRHSAGTNSSIRQLDDHARIKLLIRPDLEDRDFHGSTKASAGPEQTFPGKIVTAEKECLFHGGEDRILALHSSAGNFVREDQWQYMVHQEEEASRGLDPFTDLYSPGYFEAELAGGDQLVLMGQILRSASEPCIAAESASPILPERKKYAPLEKILHSSMAQYIVKRDECKTVIAGYPWFLDWGRDTLIAVRGLIADETFRSDAEMILKKFISFAEDGTIPNMICGNDGSNRDTSDAPLWLFTAIRDLCLAQKSRAFLDTVLETGMDVRETLCSLAESIWDGTPNAIGCDQASSLVFSPAHFTWMDTNYPAGTPRQGYPVEIQALWFAAERFLGEILEGERALLWQERARLTAGSIRKYFVLEKGYLSDCLHCEKGTSPAEASADDHLRPNQLYAVTLGAVEDPALCRSILDACSVLLIPGAIRSLADRDTEYPLVVTGPGGRALNEPHHPYKGHYEGDEDTSRKVAYHNGTAWSWQFPAWSEAFYMVYGREALSTAKAVLSSMVLQMECSCLGHICEINDGDTPHKVRGCTAQAWGMSEFLRVWKLLHKKSEE